MKDTASARCAISGDRPAVSSTRSSTSAGTRGASGREVREVLRHVLDVAQEKGFSPRGAISGDRVELRVQAGKALEVGLDPLDEPSIEVANERDVAVGRVRCLRMHT